MHSDHVRHLSVPADRWESFGPFDRSGRIKCLAIDPSDHDVVYAGSANGGVWKTTDGGRRWNPTMSEQEALAIGGLAVSPTKPARVYAATGEGVTCFRFTYPGVGVYRSDDGGETWSSFASKIPSNRCTRVLIHPQNPDQVYVSGSGGLHYSSNGGADWNTLLTGYVSDVLMDSTEPSLLYAGVWRQGVFRSRDSGRTWELCRDLPIDAPAGWIKLAMGLRGRNGTRFLLSKMGHNSGRLFSTTDGGDIWTDMAGGTEDVAFAPINFSGWTSMVAVSPEDEQHMFVGAIELMSSEGGTPFERVGVPHNNQHALVFSEKHPEVCYLANDGGVFRSENSGRAFEPRNNGLVTTQFYDMGLSSVPSVVVGGPTQDRGILVHTEEAGWEEIHPAEGTLIALDPNDSSVAFIHPTADVLRKVEIGVKGSDSPYPRVILTPALQRMVDPFVLDLAVARGDSSRILCAWGSGIFLSVDGGVNFVLVCDGCRGKVTQVAFSPSNPQVCYATTEASEVFRSDQGGQSGSWKRCPSRKRQRIFGLPHGPVRALAIGWDDPDHLYVAGECEYRHVFRSDDAGETWRCADGSTSEGTSRPDSPVNALAVSSDGNHPDTLYAATDIGMFVSEDAGDSWEPFMEGMPRVPVTAIAVSETTNCLYASTFGRGVFRRSFS